MKNKLATISKKALTQHTAKPKESLEQRHELDIDDKAKTRKGWLIFLIGFVGFFLWASFAPLDQGALMTGRVIVEGNRKTIQHLRGGVIEEILVTEGQKVEENDILLRLNQTRTDAELEQIRSRWITTSAIQARLLAEIQQPSAIKYPKWFEENAGDERVIAAISLQNELYNSRKLAREAEISGLQESIQSLRSSMTSLRDSLNNTRERLRLSNEELVGLREMAAAGYLARNRLSEAERQNSSLASDLAQETSRFAQISGQLAETNQRLLQSRSGYLADTQTRLSEIQNQVSELDQQLRTAEYDETNSIVRSPVSGYVVGLQVYTRGGVISPGQALMDVAPASGNLELRGELAINLVDKVELGMPVQVKFSSISAVRTPELSGVVRSVSADTLTDEKSGVSYYSVRVELTEDGKKEAARIGVQPGMVAEIFVKTGERTLMNYLFKPLSDRFGFALTEE